MSAGLRVLLLTPDYPPARGGIQHLLAGIVRHATRARFRVVTGGDHSRLEDGIRVRRVRPRGSRRSFVAALTVAAVAEARRFRPDVVLSGHVVMAPAARLLGVPFVQYLYAKEVTHRHGLASFAVRHAGASIVLGRHGRALALAVGAPEDRLHVIPPAIDLPPARPATARERRPLILTVARLEDRYKGFDVLIRALPLIRSRVPGATLTLVGDGPLRPELEALARANGCAGAVRFAGAVSDAERDALLREAAVFAMPSRLSSRSGGEGFGIVYLEAGAHGTPVVAGNVGGAVDAVVHGETGLLVPPDDHLEVAEAIAGLLLDRDRAAELGAGGRRWAERFAWPAGVRQVEDVLITVARRPPPGRTAPRAQR